MSNDDKILMNAIRRESGDRVTTNPRVNVRQDIWQKFSLIAGVRGLSKPQLIEIAINEFVKSHQDELKKFVGGKK